MQARVAWIQQIPRHVHSNDNIRGVQLRDCESGPTHESFPQHAPVSGKLFSWTLLNVWTINKIIAFQNLDCAGPNRRPN
jgi:hypothetical protein